MNSVPSLGLDGMRFLSYKGLSLLRKLLIILFFSVHVMERKQKAEVVYMCFKRNEKKSFGV
jgi:hypothetical protein